MSCTGRAKVIFSNGASVTLSERTFEEVVAQLSQAPAGELIALDPTPGQRIQIRPSAVSAIVEVEG